LSVRGKHVSLGSQIMLNMDGHAAQVVEPLPSMQGAVGIPAPHITRPRVHAYNPSTGKIKGGIQSHSLLCSEFKVSLGSVSHHTHTHTHTHTHARTRTRTRTGCILSKAGSRSRHQGPGRLIVGKTLAGWACQLLNQRHSRLQTTDLPQSSPCTALPPPSCSECSDLGKGQNSPLNSGAHN